MTLPMSWYLELFFFFFFFLFFFWDWSQSMTLPMSWYLELFFFFFFVFFVFFLRLEPVYDFTDVMVSGVFFFFFFFFCFFFWDWSQSMTLPMSWYLDFFFLLTQVDNEPYNVNVGKKRVLFMLIRDSTNGANIYKVWFRLFAVRRWFTCVFLSTLGFC